MEKCFDDFYLNYFGSFVYLILIFVVYVFIFCSYIFLFECIVYIYMYKWVIVYICIYGFR